MRNKLILKDGTEYEGKSFGANKSVSGGSCFCNWDGRTGNPYRPVFQGSDFSDDLSAHGNYGVPKKESWESKKIQISGLVVCNYINTPSHHSSIQTLASWATVRGSAYA